MTGGRRPASYCLPATSAGPTPNPEGGSAEQLGVRTESDQLQFVVRQAVDEQPVGGEMALAAVGVVPAKGVVTVFVGQRLLACEARDDLLEQPGVLALFLGLLHVLPELVDSAYGKH